MNLDDTIPMMQSEDYKDRFNAEFTQTYIRFLKLKNMLQKWDCGTLEFEPPCDRFIYDMQVSAMRNYLDVLAERAYHENIACECIKYYITHTNIIDYNKEYFFNNRMNYTVI